MAEEIVSVSMKKYSGQDFREVVRKINRCIDSVEKDQVALDPVTQCEVFDVDMSRSRGRFLSIPHSGAAVVVFVSNSSCLLRNVEVPEDATNE